MANELGKTGDIALDDDFTSSFIDQDVEVEEGFHFFEAKNGKYTLWLPAGYYLNEQIGPYTSKEHYEIMQFFKKRDQGFSRDLQVEYTVYEGGRYTIYIDGEPSHSSAVEKELRMLLNDSSYNNQHEKIETEDTVIYHGSAHRELQGNKGVVTDPKDSYANRYFALVHNLEGDQMVTVKYGIYCIENEGPSCTEEQEQEARFFDTFIRNIKFR